MIKEKAYAKVNLFLKVNGVKNGYHELENLMVPVSLYDELYFEKRNDNEFKIEGIDIPNNSIVKAALLFQEKYHIKGANIKIIKRIPVEAGLAGGSADSSATLRGLNKLYELNINLKDLEELANMLGSDNAYCLYNIPSLCYGRGELLNFLDFKVDLNMLLIKPQFGLSTKEIFSHVDDYHKESDVNLLLDSLRKNDYESINKYIQNDLYDVALRINSDLVNIKKELEKLHKPIFMSGSGSTLFIVSKDVKYLENIQKQITNCKTFIVKTLI